MNKLRSAVRIALENANEESSDEDEESNAEPVEPRSRRPRLPSRRCKDDNSHDEQGGGRTGAANVSSRDRMAHEAFMAYMSVLRG